MSTKILFKVVYKSSKYPQGAFEAHYHDGTANKSKQCALHVHSASVAYETIELWAEDAAKETGFKLVKTSQVKLQKQIDTGSRRNSESIDKKSTDGINTGMNRSILSSQKYLKNEIDRVFEVLGYERLTELFKVGRLYLDSSERDRNKIAQNLGKAKANMAQAMYTSFLDTGVDTSIYCNDEEILIIFNALKEECQKLL